MWDKPVDKVVSFVGNSNAGKTTLLESVIEELAHRGYRVAVVKHTYHEVEIDKPGKDTWRYARAGADMVALSSPSRLAVIESRDHEVALGEIVMRFDGRADIILAEGYKDLPTDKVLVLDSTDRPVPPFAGEVLATVAASVAPNGARLFVLEDVARVADLLVERVARRCVPKESVEPFPALQI